MQNLKKAAAGLTAAFAIAAFSLTAQAGHMGGGGMGGHMGGGGMGGHMVMGHMGGMGRMGGHGHMDGRIGMSHGSFGHSHFAQRGFDHDHGFRHGHHRHGFVAVYPFFDDGGYYDNYYDGDYDYGNCYWRHGRRFCRY